MVKGYLGAQAQRAEIGRVHGIEKCGISRQAGPVCQRVTAAEEKLAQMARNLKATPTHPTKGEKE